MYGICRKTCSLVNDNPIDQMKEPQRKNILVVDDDSSVTDSLRLILTDAGFQVLTAQTFAAAIAILSDTHFDLVLTDLCLPDVTGIELITHVKSETPETEVILMTGHGSVDITIEAIKAGLSIISRNPTLWIVSLRSSIGRWSMRL